MPRPGPAQPNWTFRPQQASRDVVVAWCQARHLDPDARGVRSQALNALIQAGAGAVDPSTPPAGWVTPPDTAALAAGERVMVLHALPGAAAPAWRLARVTRPHVASADVLFDTDEWPGSAGGGRFTRAALAVRIPPPI